MQPGTTRQKLPRSAPHPQPSAAPGTLKASGLTIFEEDTEGERQQRSTGRMAGHGRGLRRELEGFDLGVLSLHRFSRSRSDDLEAAGPWQVLYSPAPSRHGHAPPRRVERPRGKHRGAGTREGGERGGGGMPWVRPTAGRPRPAARLRPHAASARGVPVPHWDGAGRNTPSGAARSVGQWDTLLCVCTTGLVSRGGGAGVSPEWGWIPRVLQVEAEAVCGRCRQMEREGCPQCGPVLPFHPTRGAARGPSSFYIGVLGLPQPFGLEKLK